MNQTGYNRITNALLRMYNDSTSDIGNKCIVFFHRFTKDKSLFYSYKHEKTGMNEQELKRNGLLYILQADLEKAEKNNNEHDVRKINTFIECLCNASKKCDNVSNKFMKWLNTNMEDNLKYVDMLLSYEATGSNRGKVIQENPISVNGKLVGDTYEHNSRGGKRKTNKKRKGRKTNKKRKGRKTHKKNRNSRKSRKARR